ncbi:hypothetical protein [Kitasatospora nipponensis]
MVHPTLSAGRRHAGLVLWPGIRAGDQVMRTLLLLPTSTEITQ